MIKHDRPFCNNCKKEIQALTEDECLEDICGHGWSNWRTAQVHYCYECSDLLWQPPCGECETHPCERGRECWANPPLHIFPYETYYAERLENTENLFTPSLETEDREEPVEEHVLLRQRIVVAGRARGQKLLAEWNKP